MKAVTIDQLELKDHVRWAEDQKFLDLHFITDSPLVAPHPEILGMSSLYPSQLDLLFDLQKRNISWASFEAPKQFHLFGRRFFSHRLFSHFDWEGGGGKGSHGEDADDAEEQRKDPDQGLKKLMQAIAEIKQSSYQTTSVFEKDKTTVLTLLEAIEWVNDLLIQIHGRKLQYQKG